MTSSVPIMLTICRHAVAGAVAGARSPGAAPEDIMPAGGAVVRGPSVALPDANGASACSASGRFGRLARSTAFLVDTAASFLSAPDPVEARACHGGRVHVGEPACLLAEMPVPPRPLS